MRVSILLPAVAAAAISGCGQGSSPGNPDLETGPIAIDSVTIQIAESRPAQVFSRITGVVGDGCSTLLPIEQRREGALVVIEISRQRPRDVPCTQIAILFDETIRLPGEFPPGAYRLRVNDTEQAFVVD